MKRWFSALCAAVMCMALFTGCLKEERGGAPVEQKINVFTSKEDFSQGDFVIQLGNEDFVSVAQGIVDNRTETEDAVPQTAPNYILQFMPLKGGVEDAVFWWLWTAEDGTVTLVNATEDKTKAYHTSGYTSHDFGHMIEDATAGQGPKCC